MSSSPRVPITAASLREIALIFLRIGNLTFGGGNPTMAALERELVEQRRWLQAEQYGLCYSLARLTPGTNVLAFCAGSAWVLGGWAAALAAVVAASAPAALLAVCVTYAYESLVHMPLARGAIAGTLAAAVGMMGAAAWLLVRPQLAWTGLARTVILVGGSVMLSWSFAVSPVQVLALAALVGFFWRGPR
jgi:chromate transporter